MYDENTTTQLMALANLMNVKDSRWLQLEVCREFQRGQCSRSETECKFSHPPPHVEIQNGKVTACYDSIKGRCTRENPKCKYLHPPQHLKDQLLINGRNNLTLKNLLMNQLTTPAANASLGSNALSMATSAALFPNVTAATFNPYAAYALNPTAVYPGLVASPDLLGTIGSVLQSNNATTQASMAAVAAFQTQQKFTNASATANRADRVEVCREHVRGSCPRSADECKQAHPDAATVQKNGGCSDGTITVCMDFVLRGASGCSRDNCRYFHPPPHLTLKSASNGSVGGGVVQSSQTAVSRSSLSQTAASASPLPSAAASATNLAAAFAAHAAAVNAASFQQPCATAAYQSLLAAAAATQQQSLSAAQMAAMHVPRNVMMNQGLSNAIGLGALVATNGNAGNGGGGGHSNPKKRPLDAADTYSTAMLNPVSSADPYFLAAAQAFTSSTSSTKRTAMDKSGMPFYQPVSAASAAMPAATYPFSFQYPQLATAAAFPGFPTASYFPTAFTPQCLVQHDAASSALADCSSVVNFQSPLAYPIVQFDPALFAMSSACESSVKVPNNSAAVAYFDETGQLLDTLPVCRDFKQGRCDRSNCRYIHLSEDYVEVNDGKVTVCRDFAKGKCVRSDCKYYHVPLFKPLLQHFLLPSAASSTPLLSSQQIYRQQNSFMASQLIAQQLARGQLAVQSACLLPSVVPMQQMLIENCKPGLSSALNHMIPQYSPFSSPLSQQNQTNSESSE